LNLSLATAAFVIIVLGAAVGFYPISVLGVIILLGALLAQSGPPAPRRQPIPQRSTMQQSRIAPPRVAPQSASKPTPQMVPQSQPQTMFPQASNEGYASNSALFPFTMFPSMSPLPAAPQPHTQKPATEKAETQNDLVEMAAVVVLLKMLSR
jgi:hypothetical protein